MTTQTYGTPGFDVTSSVASLAALGGEQDNPEEILWWAAGRSRRLVQASTFNLEDQVITHILYEILGERVPVLFVDTLHHFPETLDVVLETRERYDLDLFVCGPEGVGTREKFEQMYGEKLWERDVEQYHRLTKIEPFQRALEDLGADGWVTGRRRDQGPSRAEMNVFELDPRGRLKANPLAYWTRQMSRAYVQSRAIPYNVLYDGGYPSIGDEPLTEPVDSGDVERSGRWKGSPKSECGMHY